MNKNIVSHTDKLNLKAVTYEIIDEKIHSLTIHEESRQAIDEIFKVVDELYIIEGTDEMMYFLIDASNIKDIPFRYMTQKVQHWRDAQAKIPPGRSALLYHHSSLMSTLVNMVVGYFNNKDSSTRIFKPDDKQQAIDWLWAE